VVFAIVLAVIHCLARDKWVVISGVCSLGLLVGVLVAFFVQEAKTWGHKELSSAVGAFAATGVLALLRLNGDPPEVWFYPIGLVVGFIIGTVWNWKPDTHGKSKK